MAKVRKDANGRVLHAGEYQRKTGTYEYKYRDANTGETTSISASTLEELREKEKETLRGIYSGVKVGATGSMTVNHVFDKWYAVKRGIKQTTKGNYKYMYDTFVRKDLGMRKLKSVKKSDVKAFYNRLYDAGMQSNTLDVIQNVLHQVFDFAIDDGHILLNPTDKALRDLKTEDRNKRLADPEHLDEVLDLEQQAKFKEFMENHPIFYHWYPIFVTMMETGMRVAEITGLTWDDVDLDEMVIHVRKNHTYNPDPETRKCVHHISTTKTVNAFRDIPMRHDVVVSMDKQRALCRPCKDVIDGVSGFVFANREGHVYHQQPLNLALKRLSREYNEIAVQKNWILLPAHLHCHMLRKTFCTNLARAGVDLRSAMELMGHGDVETTLQIYTKVTKDMMTKAVVSVDEYMRS